MYCSIILKKNIYPQVLKWEKNVKQLFKNKLKQCNLAVDRKFQNEQQAF